MRLNKAAGWRPGEEGRLASPTANGRTARVQFRRESPPAPAEGGPLSSRDDKDDDVQVHLKARARALQVHAVRGVYARAWGGPGTRTEHTSRRVGLPAQVQPGARYGPLEVELTLAGRLEEGPPAAEKAPPKPARTPSRPRRKRRSR